MILYIYQVNSHLLLSSPSPNEDENIFKTNTLYEELKLIDKILWSIGVVDPDESQQGPDQGHGVPHHLQAEADHLPGLLRLGGLGPEPVNQAQLTCSHQHQGKTENTFIGNGSKFISTIP